MSENAREVSYDLVTLEDGIERLFTPLRIDRYTVPSELFCYDVRHNDNGNPRTIENAVLVNHAGAIISKCEIPLNDGCYPAEGMNFLGSHSTLIEYLDKLYE